RRRARRPSSRAARAGMIADLKVRTRLALGFGALLALMVVMVGVAFVALREAGLQAAVSAKRDLALVAAAHAMQAAQLEQAVAIRGFVAPEDLTAEKTARESITRSAQAYEAAAALLAEQAGA